MSPNPYSRDPFVRRYGIEMLDSYDVLFSGSFDYGQGG
ncbi:MAG: hypothetical protein KatS3mg021_1887 [Fimbriimonadales bacterium]|nr:MAG: hypothetical protein KatS3mg021_1887 [Fimbriimonadales bacterium]